MKNAYIEQKGSKWILWVLRDTGYAPQLVSTKEQVEWLYDTYKKDLQ